MDNVGVWNMDTKLTREEKILNAAITFEMMTKNYILCITENWAWQTAQGNTTSSFWNSAYLLRLQNVLLRPPLIFSQQVQYRWHRHCSKNLPSVMSYHTPNSMAGASVVAPHPSSCTAQVKPQWETWMAQRNNHSLPPTKETKQPPSSVWHHNSQLGRTSEVI